MAELLAAKGWSDTHSLGLHLRAALTDEYYIVCDPTVRGHPLDAVVVGPQGLFVLYSREWEGTVRPTQRGPWRERLESGRALSHPSPRREAHRAQRAVHAFLRDELPGLRLMIHHFVVLTKPDVKLALYGTANPPCVPIDTLAQEITSVVPPSDGALLDGEARENLALALRDRGLTASQRATQPFIFRSGGLIGAGKRAWTIRQAIRHMDKHPEDGIHHLHNGTLERWFSDEGAHHLAALAQEVTRKAERDRRVSLESFLLGTGLCRRPRLSIRPRRINMGYVPSGDMVARHLRVAKGWGRGYVYGLIRTSDPWLRVEPSTFNGSLEAEVSADTEPLLITQQPSRATVYIESNASEEPISVPVRLHVEAMPATLNRYLFRPLVGFTVAGLFGAGWGWVFGPAAIQAPAWFTGLTTPSLSSAVGWAALIGLFWALLGGIRGLRQNPAWPTLYAVRRWLSRTLVWGAALSLLILALSWVAGGFYAGAGASMPETVRASVTFFAVALAIVPATVGGISSARSRQDGRDRSANPRMLRRTILGIVKVGLAVAMLVGVRLVGSALERYDDEVNRTLTSVCERAGDRWAKWEGILSGYMDQLYVRYHDRRAPVRSTPASTTSTEVLMAEDSGH